MSDGSQPALSPASEEDAGDEDRSRQPLSRLINRLAARKASDRLTLTLLVAWFQDRATLALLMIFGTGPAGSDALVFPRRFHQLHAFSHVVGDRLFDKHVLACLHGPKESLGRAKIRHPNVVL